MARTRVTQGRTRIVHEAVRRTRPVVNPCAVCGNQAEVHSGLHDAPVCRPCGRAGVMIVRNLRARYQEGDITLKEFRRLSSPQVLTYHPAPGKVSPSTNRNKESIMARTSRTAPSASSKAKATKAAASKVSTDITAAQAARDAGISGPKFRAWLRSNDMPRQWTNKTLANKAVAAFKKATAK